MDQATHNKIVSFIWGIADDVLRDLFRRGKYPDVILPMCVLRRMDAVLEPTKQAVLDTKQMLDDARITEQRAALADAAGQAFYNTSRFTLRDLKSRGSQQQLLADFEDYLTSGIERAVQYFHAVTAYLEERKSPYRAIVAFSGEHDFGGGKVTEASLNGFPSKDIADKIQTDPYRFLICADKFQTGYDEPLLHTMYVDKALSGIKAVQTLSRLNRAHPQKRECFVLDFQNNSETIKLAFQDYYRTTLLSEETDPNKLHDLKAALDGAQVYSPEQVLQFAELFLAGAERETLDPILDACAITYRDKLDEDQQVDFKGKAKAFCRTYDFLASVMPNTNPAWERLSILLNLLTAKLPAPKEEDLVKGILDAIDMDSYRVEKQSVMKIPLADADAEIAPVPTDGGGRKPEPELDRLSNILKAFNDNFGTLFDDSDRVARRTRDDIAPKVAEDRAFQNAKENTPHTARMAHDQALKKVMNILLKDDTQVYKQFVENESFRRFVGDMVYALTSE